MKWLILLLLLPLLLAGGALISNRPPFLEPPGPLTRLKLYLTANVAQTRVGHERLELRPIRLEMSESEVEVLVMNAMERLHWSETSADGGVLRAVVTTRWMRFKDNVEVHLEPVENGVLVQVRSASRVGRGDFAANTRHILDLFYTLRMVQGPEPL